MLAVFNQRRLHLDNFPFFLLQHMINGFVPPSSLVRKIPFSSVNASEYTKS